MTGLRVHRSLFRDMGPDTFLRPGAAIGWAGPSDNQLQAVNEPAEAVIVEHRLPPGIPTSQAMSMVKSAAEQIRHEWPIPNDLCREDSVNFDAPLIEATSPHRWNN